MNNWTAYKLSEAADIIAGFAFKSEEFGSVGSVPVKIKDITPPTIETKNTDRVDLSNYPLGKMRKYEIHNGDYVVAMTGATIGKVGRHVSDEILYINQRVAKIAPFTRFDKQFVYYAIQGPRFLNFILNRVDSNSAQGNISAGSIGEFPFSAPDTRHQTRVASVLSALDAKIELNQRMNEELEGMAKLLYDYWFVQFDFPMTAAQAAALGKPHLQDHPYRASGGKMLHHETLKREIPAGWSVGQIADLCRLNQSTWGNSNQPTTVSYLDLANSKDGEILGFQQYEWDQAPSRARRILSPGDTIIGMVRPGNRSFTRSRSRKKSSPGAPALPC